MNESGKLRTVDKRDDVLDVLDTKHVVDADHAVVRKAGKLSGRLVTEGRRIERETEGDEDGWSQWSQRAAEEFGSRTSQSERPTRGTSN